MLEGQQCLVDLRHHDSVKNLSLGEDDAGVLMSPTVVHNE